MVVYQDLTTVVLERYRCLCRYVVIAPKVHWHKIIGGDLTEELVGTTVNLVAKTRVNGKHHNVEMREARLDASDGGKKAPLHKGKPFGVHLISEVPVVVVASVIGRNAIHLNSIGSPYIRRGTGCKLDVFVLIDLVEFDEMRHLGALLLVEFYFYVAR